ncbi:DUF3231 family protein [Natronospora cellulosivora (SeqCode)]
MNIFKKNQTNTEKISAAEAYNIWNTLRVRYNSIETYQIFINFIHDKDLDIITKNHKEVFEKQTKILENKSKKYNIKLPSRPPAKLKFTAAIDSITDEIIFRRIYRDLYTELLALSNSITSGTVNDNLRQMFIDFFIKHLNIFESFYKYGKIKGWTEIAPTYKSSKSNDNENLSVSEANHLDTHITLRYDQKNMTQYFWTFANDIEFVKILKGGLVILEKQIKELENISEQYEIPLPDRPPVARKGTADPEMIEDKFIYRSIFSAIQNAVDLHIRAVVETTRNDKIRELFLKLLQDEMEIFDKYLKYGKLKGWIHNNIMYRSES